MGFDGSVLKCKAKMLSGRSIKAKYEHCCSNRRRARTKRARLENREGRVSRESEQVWKWPPFLGGGGGALLGRFVRMV